ncbi:hypothetical protein D3C85_891120 [compost metagenome]
MPIDRATPQAVADQADRTKAHQAPAHHRAIETGQALEHVGQIGISREHAAEHQHRKQDMAKQQGAAQEGELRPQRHLRMFTRGARQVLVQQQRLGEGHQRQHGKRTAPAQGVCDQGTHRNAEHCGTDHAETDFSDCPPSMVRPDDIHGGLTGQGPENRQAKGRDQARQAHHIDVRGQRRQGVGQAEHHQDEHKQPLAFIARTIGSQERPATGHGKSKQGHQQACLRHAHLQVTGNGRQ